MPNIHITKIDTIAMGKKVAIIFAVLFELLVIILVTPPSISDIGSTEMLIVAGIIPLAPLFYGALGFITGSIIAMMFNIASDHFGDQ
ncbi:hypothetical protein [Methanolobus profundi]|uniref:Uncharacterized protein n=1 Tax=Methanolobus profundi TaxID=487685 RepID=A0A1I4PWL9_9EURY|nr:hypothetical protein [Methanolobus profundi]SFM31996.1 hypothetical protein SAMN04488696_0939 [Methanolobus profundi]